jgi:hypothetical protein
MEKYIVTFDELTTLFTLGAGWYSSVLGERNPSLELAPPKDCKDEINKIVKKIIEVKDES